MAGLFDDLIARGPRVSSPLAGRAPGLGPIAPTAPSPFDAAATPTLGAIAAGGTAPRPVHNPSLLERLLPVSDAVAGILTPEDLEYARNQGLLSLGAGLLEASRSGIGEAAPGLGQAIARGIKSGQAGFQQAVHDRVGAAQLGEQMKMQRAAREQAAQLAQVRQQIADRFAPTGPETPQQTAARLRAMYAAYVRAGDLDTAKQLGEVIKTLGSQDSANKLQHVDAGDRVLGVDPITGEVVATYAKGATPTAPSTGDADKVLNQRYTRAHGLSSDFTRDTKIYSALAASARTMNSVAPDAISGDNAAQTALVFSFMKMLDPNSAVEQGERADAENAKGVPSYIRRTYNQLLGNGRLTHNQVRDFIEAAQNTLDAAREGFEPIYKQYRTRARSFMVDPANVTIDYFSDLPTLTDNLHDIDGAELEGEGPLAARPARPGEVGDPSKVDSILATPGGDGIASKIGGKIFDWVTP